MPSEITQHTCHLRDASNRTARLLAEQASTIPSATKIAVIEDVTGKISISFWGSLSPENSARISELIAGTTVAGPFWSGRILVIDPSDEDSVQLGNEFLRFATPADVGDSRIFIAHRYLSRGGWLDQKSREPWPRATEQVPAVCVFYSFKGGVGRSTVLAATACIFANRGKRVVVIDGDLDAPGVASTFLEPGQTIARGLVDYLIDALTIAAPRLDDYLLSCNRQELTGQGSIRVLPAGNLDSQYPLRLSHLSFGPEANSANERLTRLLERIRDEERPDVILFDARTGFTDVAATALAGIGHHHVLVGTGSGQTWQGLERALEALGSRRIRSGKKQLRCQVVLSMIPRESVAHIKEVEKRFSEQSLEGFIRGYYAADDMNASGGNAFETLEYYGKGYDEAPHVPSSVLYNSLLAVYRDLIEVRDLMVNDDSYQAIADRIETSLWPNGSGDV